MRAAPTSTANAARRNAAGFFHWEEAGEPVAVHFHLNAVELLDRDATRAGKAGTAGILLGKRDNDGPLPALVIENYEPVPTATWKTSDSPFGDRRLVKAMIDRWHTRAHRRMDVLGFYRSSTADETALTEDDLSVAGENATQPESLFLLIEPCLGQPSKGRLFLTKDAALSWEWSPSPFNRAELSGRGAPLRTEVRPPAVRKEPVRISEEPQEVSAVPERENQYDILNQRKWQWTIATLVIAVLLAAGIFHFRSSVKTAGSVPKAEMPIDSSLGLKFDRTGTDLRLSWNPNAAAIVNATSGELLINDGPVNKTVNLDSSDLRRGTITYSPLTDDLVLRLQVDTADSSGPVSESVRIVGGFPTPPSTPASPLADPSTAAVSRPTPPVSGQPRLSDKELQELIKRTSASAGHETGRAPSTSNPFLRPDPRVKLPEDTLTVSRVLPPPRRSKARQAASAGHSTVAANGNGPAVASKAASPVSSADPVRTSVESIPVIPAASSSVAFTSSVPRYTRRGGAVQPAQLLTNINPVYPAAAKQSGISGLVELHFKISSTGDVHDIVVVKGPQVLAQAAVDAVRERRYKPARVDGVPTETDASGTFDFKLN